MTRVGVWDIELAECADEQDGVQRFCRLARAYTLGLGQDDVFRIQGRLQGTQVRELSWTPADGPGTLLTMVADYREYFEGIFFPRVDHVLLADGAADATTIRAHGVGLRLLAVHGLEEVANRVRALAYDVDDGAAASVNFNSTCARERRMALFASTWPDLHATAPSGDRHTRDANRKRAAHIMSGLRKALLDEDAAVRGTAATITGRYRILGLLGDVRPLLADGDAGVRAAAIRALRDIDEDAAIPLAAPLLCDANADVRNAAFSVLRHLSHVPWARRREMMGEFATDVRAAWGTLDAAQSLQMMEWMAGCSQPSVLQALLSARQEGDPQVRCKLAQILGSLERDDVVAHLVDLLDDDSDEVQAQALEALSQERLKSILQQDAPLLDRVMRRLRVISIDRRLSVSASPEGEE